MFSLRSQLFSSLSNSKAGYLSRLPSANRFASALPCTSVSTKGGNLCIVLCFLLFCDNVTSLLLDW